MVKIKAIYLITDQGFTIYNQSFGALGQDQDMYSSLLMALRSFGREAGGKSSLSQVEFGEGADMILESGKRIIAIAVVVLDNKAREQEEYSIRNDLLKLVKKVEEMYDEELEDPIFQKSDFSEVETLIKEYFQSDG